MLLRIAGWTCPDCGCSANIVLSESFGSSPRVFRPVLQQVRVQQGCLFGNTVLKKHHNFGLQKPPDSGPLSTEPHGLLTNCAAVHVLITCAASA
jgi:hypothetical protein